MKRERERDNNFHPKNASKIIEIGAREMRTFFSVLIDLKSFFFEQKKTTRKSIEHESGFMLKESERERENVLDY
jgi:hypothetical protein